MKRTGSTRRRRLASAIGCVLVVTACNDAPTASRSPLAPSRSLTESAGARGDTMFVTNARKYSDVGHHPSSARAGSATLSALALLSGDGTADVEVASGEWDGWTRGRQMREDPYGGTSLSKVQLKVFAPDGKLRTTRNFSNLDSSATLPGNGLVRGGHVQVQANIKGADVSRTGVVTVDAPVRLRPDLAVTALQRPPRAALNTAVPIVAVVRELNGDLGAWADCVLYVDGVEQDRAYGIWVDAGGTVSITFMHMFRTLADTRLEVRVERVAPGDFDASNNVASGIMPVIRVPSSFYFDASFEDVSYVSTIKWESSWSSTDGQGAEQTSADSSSGREQRSMMSASIPRAVSFPLTEVFARQLTRDEVAHSVLFRGLPADWTYNDGFTQQSCVSRGYDQPATGRGWLYICSNRSVAPDNPGFEWTSVQYDRYAGDVTYASRGHSHYWNRDLGYDDVYSWNYSSRDVAGRFVSYGLEYGFFIRLIDGARTYTANPLIGLLPFESAFRSPRTCWSWEDPFGSSRSCSEGSSEQRGVHGSVWGEPTP
jgi:hypothetical protein